MNEEFKIALRRLKIGEAWEADSSLEKWFPLTAEELVKLKTQAATDKYVIRRLVEAIDQYFSENGYSTSATILTNARADAVNLNQADEHGQGPMPDTEESTNYE